MIRKAIIAVLTVAAVAVGIGMLLSVVLPTAPLAETTWVTPSGAEVGGMPASGIVLYNGRLVAQVIHEDQQQPRRWAVSFAGFFIGRTDGKSVHQTESLLESRNFRVAKVRLPLWMPLILFATYPTIAFIRGPLRRYRRRTRGLCLKCGYDLTGNVTGVCPECGARIAAGTRRSCGV